MRKIGYNLQHGKGLNFEKGQRGFLRNFMPKGKLANYYDKTHRGLGYITPPILFQSEDNESIPLHSASLSEWGSDVNIGMLFKDLSINMTSINRLEHEEAIEMFDIEPWAQQVNFQWEKRFEQREPPIEDRMIQVKLGSQDHPKPISISESLSLIEREELIALVREYIDVFAWNYEDMPGLDPQVAMHRLNIKPDVKSVKQQQRRFRPNIMEAIEAEAHKLVACRFIWEEQHPDWVANIVPILKKNKKIRVRIDYRYLNAACPKDEFPLPITDVMIDNTCGFERISFMDDFSGYNQIKM